MPVRSRKSKDPLAAGATVEGGGGRKQRQENDGAEWAELCGPVDHFPFTLSEVGGRGPT